MSFVLLLRERVVVLSFLTSAFAGLGTAGFVASPAIAQSITTSGDTDTQVTQVGDRYTINGTTISGDGANLFHSFEQFGLDANEIAEFIADPDIQNILGRVVGGQVSLIDGLIEVTGADANLFLMNPAGVIFGPNAQLNVPADFTATTATGIGIGDDWFSALGNNDYANLVGDPSTFAFGVDEPGAIANLGNLAVGEGQTLSLVGGTVINAGTLEAPGGTINIAAVPGQNLVRISQDGFLLSLDIEPLADSPTQPNAWTLPIATLPELLTGGGLDDDLNVTVNADGTITLDGSGITLPTEPGTALVAGAINTATETDGVVGSVVNVVGDRAIFFSETTFGPRYDPDFSEELDPQPGELTGSLDETTVLAVNVTDEIRVDLPESVSSDDPEDPAQGAGLFFSVGTGNDDEGDLRFTTQGSFVMDAEANLFSRGRDITIRAGEIIAGEINTFDGAGANYFGPTDDDRFPQRSGNVELEVEGDIQVTRIFGEDILLVSANGNIQTGSISSEADTFPIPADDGQIYLFGVSEDGINREIKFDTDPLVGVEDLPNLNNVLNQGEGSNVVVIATNGSIDLDGYIRAGQTNKTSDSTITITAQRFRAVNPLTVPFADENGQITDENGQSTGRTSSVNLIAYSRNTDPPESLGGTTGRNSLQASFGEGGLLSLQFGDQEAQVQVIDENGNPQTVLLSELESDEPILAQIQLLGDTTFSIAEFDDLPPDTSGMVGGFGVGGRRDPSVNPGALSNSFAALPPPVEPPINPPVDPGNPTDQPPGSPINNSLVSQQVVDFEPVAQVVCEPEETIEVSAAAADSAETPVLDIASVVSVELLRSAGIEDNEEGELVTECD